MNHTTMRFYTLISTIALALVALSGVLAASAAASGGGVLHYKSQAGLMPPAYGLPPDGLARAAAAAPAYPYLHSYVTVTVGSWPHVLALADLTGDGYDDAALATGANLDSTNDERLHLFAGIPLTLVQRLPAGSDPESLVAADLSGDGGLDVAVALAGDDALALYTQSSATLSGLLTITLPGAPDALATGDWTGDLHPDLAAVAPHSATIRLWAGGSAGLSALPVVLSYPTGGYDALAVGDLDNDGDDDLVALRGAGYLTQSLVVYLQDSGTFPISYTRSPETGGYLPHSLAVGDVNGDGLDDVVVTAGGNAPHAYLNLFLQGASGLAATPITYTTYHLPSAVAIADLNHDGREDVIVLHDAWRTLSVFTQTVSGTLSAYAIADVPYSDRYRPDSLALGDINRDGGLDVALVDRDHGLVILHNTLTAPSATILQPAPRATLSPGPLVVSGTASSGAITVQVRLRGQTDWQTATMVGSNWQISLTLPAVERAWWVEARAIDTQGRVQSPPARHRIAVEDGPPCGQIIIENGAYATNHPTVTLTLPAYDVGGVTTMRFSLDGVFFSEWVTYSLTYSWTFPSGDGLKTLYAQFQDVDDNVSTLVSDTIILDTAPPESFVAALPLTTYCTTITPTWSGADESSGVAFYDVQIRQGDAGDWISLLQHTDLTQTVVQLAEGQTYCFRSRATDRAGNVEEWPSGDGDTCTFISTVHEIYLPLVMQGW